MGFSANAKAMFRMAVLIMVLFPQHMFSFTQHRADSLKRELSLKVDAGDESVATIGILLALAGEYVSSAPNTALEYYLQTLELVKKIKVKEEEAEVYNFIGRVYEQQGLYHLAMENYFNSLSLNEQLSDSAAITWGLTDIGNIYYTQQDYTSAKDYYQRALAFFEFSGNQYGIATIFNNLALVYEGLNDPDSALTYYNRALVIRQGIGNPALIAHSYLYIGRIYEYRSDFKRALEFYQQSHDLYGQANSGTGQAQMHRYMGNIYHKLDSTEACFENYQKALDYYTKFSHRANLANTYGDLANACLTAENLSQAIPNAKNMLNISKMHGLLIQQRRANYLLSETYRKLGRYKESLNYFKQYELIKDSISSQEVAETISKLEFMNEREKRNKVLLIKENEIEFLERNERINDFKKNALTVGIILLFVIGILIFSRQYNIHKKNLEIIAKNREIQQNQVALMHAGKKEKQRLEQELNLKNVELTNFALHIVQKNDLLYGLKKKLQYLNKITEPEKSRKLNEVIASLIQNMKLKHELRQFQDKVDQVNSEFFKNLDQKYPELTENEKRLIALLRLNLSNKEIASLNNISVKGVEMGRYRLRKKFSMDPQANILEFVQGL
nr:transcriptional regulator [Bacteroidota bacterium]